MKAPFYRSAALLGIVLMCGAGFTSAPFPAPPQSLSMVVDIAPQPSLPSPKSEQLLFRFMVVTTMRQASEKDWYQPDPDLPPTPNDFHPHARLVCTIPPPRHREEPVHKPPWV